MRLCAKSQQSVVVCLKSKMVRNRFCILPISYTMHFLHHLETGVLVVVPTITLQHAGAPSSCCQGRLPSGSPGLYSHSKSIRWLHPQNKCQFHDYAAATSLEFQELRNPLLHGNAVLLQTVGHGQSQSNILADARSPIEDYSA